MPCNRLAVCETELVGTAAESALQLERRHQSLTKARLDFESPQSILQAAKLGIREEASEEFSELTLVDFHGRCLEVHAIRDGHSLVT